MSSKPGALAGFREHVLVKHRERITRDHLETAADVCLVAADMRFTSDEDGNGMGTAAVLAVVDPPSPHDVGLSPEVAKVLDIGPEDLVQQTKEWALASDAFVVALKEMDGIKKLPRLANGLVAYEAAGTAFLEAAQILRDMAREIGYVN